MTQSSYHFINVTSTRYTVGMVHVCFLLPFNSFHPEARPSHQLSSARSERADDQNKVNRKAVDLDHIILNGLSFNFHSKVCQKLCKIEQNKISRRQFHFGGKTRDQYEMS